MTDSDDLRTDVVIGLLGPAHPPPANGREV